MSAISNMEPSPNSASPEDEARASLYKLLGLLLAAPPNEQTVGILGRLEVPEDAKDSELSAAWRQLKQFSQAMDCEALEEEYTNLFIGLGKGELSPYMSWYLTGNLMEQPLARLRSELARLGFTRQEHVSEPEDHVAAICEVMGMQLSENSLSFKQGKQFFDDFILPWMAEFFRDLERAKSAQFYKSVGRLGLEFLQVERQFYSMPA